jgi:hypothetical protein
MFAIDYKSDTWNIGFALEVLGLDPIKLEAEAIRVEPDQNKLGLEAIWVGLEPNNIELVEIRSKPRHFGSNPNQSCSVSSQITSASNR